MLSGEPQAQAYVKEILSKFSLNFTSEEELIDVCLIALTIMSYSMVKRADLMVVFDKLVMTHLAKLM